MHWHMLCITNNCDISEERGEGRGYQIQIISVPLIVRVTQSQWCVYVNRNPTLTSFKEDSMMCILVCPPTSLQPPSYKQGMIYKQGSKRNGMCWCCIGSYISQHITFSSFICGMYHCFFLHAITFKPIFYKSDVCVLFSYWSRMSELCISVR